MGKFLDLSTPRFSHPPHRQSTVKFIGFTKDLNMMIYIKHLTHSPKNTVDTQWIPRVVMVVDINWLLPEKNYTVKEAMGELFHQLSTKIISLEKQQWPTYSNLTPSLHVLPEMIIKGLSLKELQISNIWTLQNCLYFSFQPSNWKPVGTTPNQKEAALRQNSIWRPANLA